MSLDRRASEMSGAMSSRGSIASPHGVPTHRAAALGDLSFVANSNSVVLSATRAFLVFVGRDSEQIVGESVDSMLLNPEDEPGPLSQLLEAIAPNSIANLDVDRRRFKFACVENSEDPDAPVNGEWLQVESVVAHADVLIVRVAPPAVRRKGVAFSRNKAQIPEDICLVVDSLRHPSFICSLQGTIEHWNDAAVAIFGLKPEEVLGMNVDILVPHPYGPHHQAYMDSFRGEPEIPNRHRFLRSERGIVARGKKGGDGEDDLGMKVKRKSCLIPVRLSIAEVRLGKDRNAYLCQCRKMRIEGMLPTPPPSPPPGAAKKRKKRIVEEEENEDPEQKIVDEIKEQRDKASAEHIDHPFILGPPAKRRGGGHSMSPHGSAHGSMRTPGSPKTESINAQFGRQNTGQVQRSVLSPQVQSLKKGNSSPRLNIQ